MFIVRFPGCAGFMFMTWSWMGLSCCPYLCITQYCSTGGASSSASDQSTMIWVTYVPFITKERISITSTVPWGKTLMISMWFEGCTINFIWYKTVPLRYKPAGRGFDSRWCHWNSSVTSSFRSHYGPGVDSASNRNEYQVYFLEVKAAGAWGWQPYIIVVFVIISNHTFLLRTGSRFTRSKVSQGHMFNSCNHYLL